MMMAIAKVECIMQMIIAQLLFVIVIDARNWSYDNETNNDSQQQSVRSRRAPFHRYIPPNTLTATIRDGDKEIHLTWEVAERYLFNENLPVYTTHINEWGVNHKKSEVMKNVGRTIKYHDTAQKSAVIYFENMDQLHGVVGKSYSIMNLPIDALSQPLIVGGPYVTKMRRHPPHERTKLNSKTFLRRPKNNADKGEINPVQAGTSNIRTPQPTLPEAFYVETLLLVTNDVVEYARSRYHKEFIKGLVMVYLLHLNAVDMVYAMLPRNDFEVYINLAGIILEEENGAFSKILHYPALKYNGERDLYVDGFLLDKFSKYSNHFDFPFVRDSFDLILVSTGRELRSHDTYFPGLNWIVKDIFRERHEDNQHIVIPTALVGFPDAYSTYPVVARNIGNILGIAKYDPLHKGMTQKRLQCYGIMQIVNHHCTDCITWSHESIKQLKVFFRTNRNRCFLLNKPRSLHPPDTPVISVSPCRQCTCFGFSSYSEETPNECPLYIPSNGCEEPLQCKYTDPKGESQSYPTILPLHGTPCGENKVCWDDECKSLPGTA